jgi:hypothetical protein
MTVVDRDAAQASAIQIRDETGTALNTAARVGGAFLDLADSVLFSGAAADLEDRTIIRESIAGTALPGLVIHNPTAAALGAPQYSPALVLQGEGWETTGGTRREVYVRWIAQGIQGASVTPQWALALDTAAEGTAPDAAPVTPVLAVTPTLMTYVGSLAIGPSPATFGGLRIPKSETNGLWSLNDAGDNNVLLLALEPSGNVLRLGGAGTVAGTSAPANVVINAVTDHQWKISNVTEAVLSATALDLQNNNVVTTGNIDLGAELEFRAGVDSNAAIAGNGEAMIGLNIAGSGVRNLELFGDGSGAQGGWDNYLYWAAAVTAPVLTQAPAASGNGALMTLQAQNTPGTGTVAGGSLILQGGSATAASGTLSGGGTVIAGGDVTNGTVGTSQAGGAVLIRGGNYNGLSGTRTGGDVLIFGGGSAGGGTDGSVLIKGSTSGDAVIEVDGSGLGFFTAAPIAQPAAYTQTYSTATRTHANPTATALTDSTGGTADNTVAAVSGSGADATINNNFADLIAKINALITDLANAKQVLNQVVDDGQSYGLLQ